MNTPTREQIIRKDFGRWLSQQIASHQMNQAEFARKIGGSTGAVSMWLQGKRLPDPASCERIAKALGHHDSDLVMTMAHHIEGSSEYSPDDPRAVLSELVGGIDWNDQLVKVTVAMLDAMPKISAPRERE